MAPIRTAAAWCRQCEAFAPTPRKLQWCIMFIDRQFARRVYNSLAPRDLRVAVTIRRTRPLWRRAGLIFIHIPKAAGTSVNMALIGRSPGHATAAQVRTFAPVEFRDLPTFSLVRNPWARCLSTYRFVRNGGSDVPIWRPERFQRREFRSFAAFVEEWLVEQDVRRTDVVFRPQHQFIADGTGAVLVDHVGFVERMPETATYLEETFGRKVEIGHLNRTNGEPTDYHSFYTSGLVDTVGKIYARDVEMFGYSF